jgi:hypothetical protein
MGDPKLVPPVPIRSGFVVALVVIGGLVMLPFGVAILFEDPEGVAIEPGSRVAGAVAMLVAPAVAMVVGVRRRIRLRIRLVRAAGTLAASCLATLVVVTSVHALAQVALMVLIAGSALHAAFSAGNRPRRDAPARPDLPESW